MRQNTNSGQLRCESLLYVDWETWKEQTLTGNPEEQKFTLNYTHRVITLQAYITLCILLSLDSIFIISGDLCFRCDNSDCQYFLNQRSMVLFPPVPTCTHTNLVFLDIIILKFLFTCICYSYFEMNPGELGPRIDHSFIHSFIYWFNKYLSSYGLPGTLFGIEEGYRDVLGAQRNVKYENIWYRNLMWDRRG